MVMDTPNLCSHTFKDFFAVLLHFERNVKKYMWTLLPFDDISRRGSADVYKNENANRSLIWGKYRRRY